VSFSVELIMAWTIVKRGWDFSVTAFPNERFYMHGGPGVFNLAAVVIGALFKYLHFNHLTFYLFNVLMSVVTVIVFFHLARTCLNRKLALYVTAIFAFNPELALYNNFVLKENLLILAIVTAMYCFFKALDTNGLIYKIQFLLLVLLVALIREPLVFMGLLSLAFVGKSTRRGIILTASFVLLPIMYGPCAALARSYWFSHLGNYGATKAIFEDIYGVPTSVTFGEVFSSPALFAEYFSRSLLYYLRPGWSTGLKFNSFLVPYTLFVVYVFVASFPYRKHLTSTYRTAYLLITFTVILISLILIIYDPSERYRYSVYQLGFTLLVLNFRGYQECMGQVPCAASVPPQAMVECATA
jgi:4-amino-4-deoxy-L-arabinose transferase-like glycosyltransferase